jgi:hypothetical protein
VLLVLELLGPRAPTLNGGLIEGQALALFEWRPLGLLSP